jgi:undecaprenyl-diphosphatase
VCRGLGFERDAAARLVFLMSLPIIAGAGVFALADASIPSDFWPPFLWGMAASALTGWVAVWGTLKLVQTRTFAPFVAYRIVLGIVVLLILATGWR